MTNKASSGRGHGLVYTSPVRQLLEQHKTISDLLVLSVLRLRLQTCVRNQTHEAFPGTTALAAEEAVRPYP